MENELKLIKISTKSWHYKLMKWYLGDATPTSSNTFNFCRYFWILMFVIVFMIPVITPFKLFVKLLIWTGELGEKIIFSRLGKSFEKWIENLTEEDIAIISREGASDKIPKRFKKYCDKKYGYYEYTSRTLDAWFKTHKKMDRKVDSEATKNELELIREKLRLVEEERKRLEEARNKKRKEREARNSARIEKINAKFSFISDGFDTLITNIKKLGNYDYSTMIKVAKKITSVLITALFLFLTYCFAHMIIYACITIGILIIDNWHNIYVYGGIGLGGIASISLLVLLGHLLVQKIIDFFFNIKLSYDKGEKLWYIQMLYLGIVRPLYYLVYVPMYWLAIIPLNFIFVHLIWNLICVRVIAGFAKWFWKGFINFTGIFGEYFSASKGDYCPGLEWDDDNE